MIEFPIKGVKWFREIINDKHRQFGIEVHATLPEKKIPALQYGQGTSIIRLPEQQKLVEDMEYYFGGLPATKIYPETYAATIENGTIIGNSGMIITPDGYLIAETASMTGYRDGRCYMIEHLKKRSFNPPYKGHISSRVLSLANPNAGYAHHMRESFFSLLWFDNQDIDLIHVVEGPNLERMREFTEDLGIPDEMFLVSKKMEMISADRVSFFAPCAYLLYRSETANTVRRVLLEPFIREGIKPVRKVYPKSGVKTVGAKMRSIPGSKKLERFLIKEGYEVIDLATLSLIEKINYLQEIDTMLVVYGSSVANINLSLNDQIKVVSISGPNAIIQGNIMGHNGFLPTYSCPVIYPVYPDFCFSNGYLMTTEMIHLYYGYRFPKGQFFSCRPSQFTSNFSFEIDMDMFKKFYKYYTEKIAL